MRMINLFKLISPPAAALVLLAGCAPQTLPSYNEGAQTNLSVEMRRLQSALHSQERSLRELDEEVVDLNTRVDLQQKELDELRIRLSRAVTDKLPAGTTTSPAVAPSSEMAQVAAELEGTPTDIYLRAFGDYANARYPEAILGFKAFLENFPNNSYASNAQFWLADSYFKQQDLPAAIEEFDQLVQSYPRAAKAPEALLKTATAQLRLGQPEQARETLEVLHRQYPQSSAAQKAEKLDLP